MTMPQRPFGPAEAAPTRVGVGLGMCNVDDGPPRWRGFVWFDRQSNLVKVLLSLGLVGVICGGSCLVLGVINQALSRHRADVGTKGRLWFLAPDDPEAFRTHCREVDRFMDTGRFGTTAGVVDLVLMAHCYGFDSDLAWLVEVSPSLHFKSGPEAFLESDIQLLGVEVKEYQTVHGEGPGFRTIVARIFLYGFCRNPLKTPKCMLVAAGPNGLCESCAADSGPPP